MSDDDEYYDADEFLFWDDEPADDVAAWADDLAEHAVHSPVWQQDPTIDLADHWSDWEYYSDDYYDVELAPQREKLPGNGEQSSERPTLKRKRTDNEVGRKKQRVNGTDGEPHVSHPQPTTVVQWRTKTGPGRPPVLDDDGVETVALLSNWRELLQARRKAVGKPPGSKQRRKGHEDAADVGALIDEAPPNQEFSSASLRSAEIPSGTKDIGPGSKKRVNRRTGPVTTSAAGDVKPIKPKASSVAKDRTSTVPSKSTNTVRKRKISDSAVEEAAGPDFMSSLSKRTKASDAQPPVSTKSTRNTRAKRQ